MYTIFSHFRHERPRCLWNHKNKPRFGTNKYHFSVTPQGYTSTPKRVVDVISPMTEERDMFEAINQAMRGLIEEKWLLETRIQILEDEIPGQGNHDNNNEGGPLFHNGDIGYSIGQMRKRIEEIDELLEKMKKQHKKHLNKKRILSTQLSIKSLKGLISYLTGTGHMDSDYITQKINELTCLENDLALLKEGKDGDDRI